MNPAAPLAATPTKLRSGLWGATVRSDDVSVGDVVVVTTRAGQTWAATVTEIVWVGNDVTVVATSSRSAGPRKTPSYSSPPSYSSSSSTRSTRQDGCRRCRQTPTRTAQLWEECGQCGTQPIYQ